MAQVDNPQSFERIFAPKNVVVIGASERSFSVGHTVMKNLLAAPFGGSVYPVNPKHSSIFGRKCYPSIENVPVSVDLAIIATPAKTVPRIIAECVQAKVFAAVIISAGFKEAGAQGIVLEEEILFHSRGRMRIIGPNCLGIMRPATNLNATFAHGMALPGSCALISQSGALCTAILDWSLKERVGFSAFISIGSMIDVNWADLLEYFNNDLQTKSILIYMESVGDAYGFLSAAQKVSIRKPIVVLKTGRSLEAAAAAISHTGSLAGNDELFSAAMERAHVLRIDSIADLFNYANFLAKQPIPKGLCLTIVTNAGGPGVIATDTLMETGGQLTVLSDSAIRSYDDLLAPYWSHNPIDILGDASAKKFADAVQIAAKERASDGTLVILTPQDMTDPLKTAELLKPFAHLNTPMLASWMGGDSVEKGKDILNQFQIPVFPYPDMAVQTFTSLGKYAKTQPSLEVETLEKFGSIDFQIANQIIHTARKENRVILNEWESKKVIQSFGIQTVRTEIAHNPEEALQLSQEIGFPVVLKLYSYTITHKAKAGGVKLNLNDSKSVIDAYRDIKMFVERTSGTAHFQGVTIQPMILGYENELLIGSMSDEQFGPAIMFGLGGSLVEFIHDRAIGFPPLSKAWARRMMNETKIYQAVKNNADVLEEALIRLSNLIIQHPCIKECDINPIVISNNQPVALDARIILHEAYLKKEDLPLPVFLKLHR